MTHRSKPSASKILEALETLDSRTRVTRGSPANAEWIAAQEKEAETTFDPSYVAFLEELGALRLETDELDDWHADLVFPGHAPEAAELQLGPALEWLRDTFESWSAEPLPGAPVMMFGDGSGWPDALVTADGKLFRFHRQDLYAQQRDFEAEVLAKIEAIHQGLAKAEAVDEVRGGLIEACAGLAPASWSARHADGHTIFRRPSDGVDIDVRLGDGRELSGSDGEQGVFVTWYDRPQDLETLNTWNLRAAFVRASPEGQRTRYRGLLAVTGLDPHHLLELIAHDAELPFEAAPRPVPAIEALRTAIAAPPAEASIFATRWSAKDLRTEGDAVVLQVAIADPLRFGREDVGPQPEATVRGRPDGLVEVVFRSKANGSRADVLQCLASVNGNPLGDVNADLEHCVRGVLEANEMAALSIVCPFGALPTKAFLSQVRNLSRAIASATIFAKPDPLDPLCQQVQAQLGRTVGPHLRALLEYLHRRALGVLQSGAKRRFQSPWGTLVEIGAGTDRGVSFARHTEYVAVAVALAIDHGTTSDDCPVVVVEVPRHHKDPLATSPARLLARDLRDFVSVLQLRTTAFDFDGDDDFVWRSYRAALIDGQFGLPFPEVELGQQVGVDPSPSVAKVLAAAAARLPQLPSTGEVRS